MATKHGVFASKKGTSVSTPVVAATGIPFVIGCAPVQSASEPAAAEIPVLCSSWDEFEAQFGYSTDWEKYNLCEFAYSHFKLYGRQPIIVCNLLDPKTMKETVGAQDLPVQNLRVTLPIETVIDTIVIKQARGVGDPYELDTDYTAFVSENQVIVELIGSSIHAGETSLNVSYSAVTPASVQASTVASKMDNIELCMSTAGVIPDLIVSPEYSSVPSVAAVMATKASAINGLFKAKALIDIDSTVNGCLTYNQASAYKTSKNLVDETEILCWPMMKLGEQKYHMSTQLAGLIATVDSANNCPYASPSNNNFKMDSLCLADGTVITQTKAQADALNAVGVVTALNFLASGWVCWGNCTACYPSVTDVTDYFIPVSRMFDWVGSTMIQTFWNKLDKPTNTRLVEDIVNTINIWLRGLSASGYLHGGRAEVLESENPKTDLMAGILRVHLYLAPPSPAQEIDFIEEYDETYVITKFAA